MGSVDIIVKEKTGSAKIEFPWNPDEIKYKSRGTEFASYKLLDMGEVSRPSGIGLAEISWEGIFPGESRKGHPFLKGNWKKPSDYQKLLTKWEKKKKLLKITVTGTPVNMYCYLKDFECTYSGGAGDYHYKVDFVEYRAVSIKKKSKKKGKNSKKKSAVKSATKRPASSSGTYVVKSGDCLMYISKKFFGESGRWKEIYTLNKSVIEKAAKKRGLKSSSNGHWIFAGTKLKIPKK